MGSRLLLLSVVNSSGYKMTYLKLSNTTVSSIRPIVGFLALSYRVNKNKPCDSNVSLHVQAQRTSHPLSNHDAKACRIVNAREWDRE